MPLMLNVVEPRQRCIGRWGDLLTNIMKTLKLFRVIDRVRERGWEVI